MRIAVTVPATLLLLAPLAVQAQDGRAGVEAVARALGASGVKSNTRRAA
jgi:hypothetical protein